MLTSLISVSVHVAILFVMVGIGMICRKTHLVDEKGNASIVNVLLLVVTPSLIVDAFQRPFDPSMLRGLALAFLFAALSHVFIMILSRFAVREADENNALPLRLSAIFSNAGFMGIPLEQALLGDAGVFYGAAYVAVFNLFIWSWGVQAMGRKGDQALSMKTFVNPGTVGLAIGLPLFFASIRLPQVLAAPVHELASLNTPLAMIVVGYSLAGVRIRQLRLTRSAGLSMVLRLIVAPLVMIGVFYPLAHALDRNMMLAMVIASSAPVAAMVLVFSSKFNRNVDLAAAMVCLSTILSIVTMPIVVSFAMTVL